jgi:hypothetical protein
MKKILPVILVLSFVVFSDEMNAQWCVPTTAVPYASTQPGITHFTINTIDRTSADLENFPYNSYVNTGLSTDLIKGESYDVSITYTIDASICPDMNLRVWIDFNHDGQLDDIDETVISANNQLPGTYYGSFTVPQTAMPGVTRMRVTAKMTPNGGHTIPTPCDMPPDPIGYHGEIEDYDVDITDLTGIVSPNSSQDFNAFVANGKINFSVTVTEMLNLKIDLLDVQGRIVENILPKKKLMPGKLLQEITIDEMGIKPGIYFAVFSYNNDRWVRKIFVD